MRLYGHHAVREAWLNPARICHRLWLSEGANAKIKDVFEQAANAPYLPHRPKPEITDGARLDRLAGSGAVHQGIVIEVDPLPEMFLSDLLILESTRLAQEPDSKSIFVMLDQVTDPHNVGAILRSAASFGASAMLVQSRHAPDITGTLAKVASGAVEIVPMVRITNLSRAIEELQDEGYTVIGLDEDGVDIRTLKPERKTVLVLGAEGDGLRPKVAETCTHLVKLPTKPPIQSLNVSNAAAVALFWVG